VSEEFALRSTFFVEDTSLRIEALSETSDYPGMEVKEWFPRTSFTDLDHQIEIRNGSRLAVIKSDIALRIPGLSRPIFFHGETRGAVALTPPDFEGSIQYPWLSPSNFNGWFIPEGATKRLGEMEFEESLDFDFRAKALIQLVRRLEELSSALNLGRAQYYVRRATEDSGRQLALLTEPVAPIFIVVGHKCAGKTTFSDFVVSTEGVVGLEGSTILRQIAEREGTQISSSEEAFGFLESHGFDVVAKEVARCIRREDATIYIVSGMRTIEEVEYLLQEFGSARLVWIEADVQDRFERHLKRARDRDVKTLSEFAEQDETQMHFGLLRAGPEIADFVLRNDQDLDDFYARVRVFLRGRPRRRTRWSGKSELHRCLEALAGLGRAATCEEISARTADFGPQVRRYNTNRALKDIAEFATRLEPGGGKLLRYRITPTGVALLRLLNREVDPR
jgi:dephospho-CoA kinase/inosine/xanthosine triphosphate pyrophosphatase family protein